MNARDRHSRAHQAATMADIAKACRSGWVSRPKIAEAVGVKVETASAWVAQMVRHGVLIERMGDKVPGSKGQRPMVYRLAAEWGGQ